jgi:hypothetical protein
MYHHDTSAFSAEYPRHHLPHASLDNPHSDVGLGDLREPESRAKPSFIRPSQPYSQRPSNTTNLATEYPHSLLTSMATRSRFTPHSLKKLHTKSTPSFTSTHRDINTHIIPNNM